MNLTELLSSPSMIHAAVVHMPIAAGVLGLIFIIISALFHRNNAVRALTALMYLILAASAYVAIETGESARDLVSPEAPKAIWDQLTAHADSAEKVMYAGVFTLVCLLISLIRLDSIRITGLLLAAVGAIVTNIFVVNTGHLGGVLVYKEGLGTPFAHRPAAPPTPLPAPTEPVPAPVEPVPAPVEPVPAPVEPVPAPVEPVPAPAEPVPAPAEPVPAPAEPVPAPVEPVPAPAVVEPARPGTESAPAAPAPAPVAVEPVAAPVAENPDWLPIREFTMEEAAKVSYIRDVWPIIDDQCISCHENPDADGDYDMTTVELMLKGGKKGGPGVVPGKPDESAIIKYVRGMANPRMPEDEPPLPDDMLHTLRMWIAAGAIDDTNGPAPAPAAAAVESAPLETPAEPIATESTPG